jgi:hypothetical protein
MGSRVLEIIWVYYNAANKYAPQTIVADAGTGKLNLTSTLTFDAVGNVTDTVTNAYDADGRLICSAAQIGTQQKLGSDSN